jgi:hypothetical protein
MPIAPNAQASRSGHGRSAPATRNAATMASAFCQGRIGETVTKRRFAAETRLLLGAYSLSDPDRRCITFSPPGEGPSAPIKKWVGVRLVGQMGQYATRVAC